MNDALDDILAESDDESEEQAVINQVLDEIGIEITNKVIRISRFFHQMAPLMMGLKLPLKWIAIFNFASWHSGNTSLAKT